ncbi:hypothetical protein HMPREF3227_02022 [Corynebacterium sp. CMW7794]|nr:hypothetical protein HMPREF3227_02022 [Corynebacterium sp. CMW7794]
MYRRSFLGRDRPCQRDDNNDVYYCSSPQAADIETLGIYVLAAAWKDGAPDWSYKVIIPGSTPGSLPRQPPRPLATTPPRQHPTGVSTPVSNKATPRRRPR